MSTQLEQLREQLKQKAAGGNNQARSGGDNALYPFWNAKNDTQSVVRFLPDGKNPDNPFFWAERRVTKLMFDGVIGRPEYSGKQVYVSVPCMKMYDPKLRCPIIEGINPFWNTENHETALRFYPKRTFIMQGFVRSVPEFVSGKEDVPPENPIRRFSINQPLHKNIQQAILDPDMRNMPTDYMNGTDFRIAKTQQGQYASYSTSNFARNESALTQEEQDAISKFGLFDLSEFLPNRPTEEGVAVIEEMFLASLAGLPYDPKWADFYRPYNFDAGNQQAASNTGVANAAANAVANSTATQTTTPPWNSNPGQTTGTAPSTPAQTPAPEQAAPAPAGGQDSPTDALARLRAQVNNQQ